LFETTPTKEDTARIYRLAEDVLQEARSGADFNKLADEYSEDPSVKTNHGDLGYFERSGMVKEFADAAFSAKPGEIVGPVKTQFGLHIIKVIDRKREGGKEKVRAAQILLKFTPGYNTIENAQYAADNFAEIARDEGFELTADRLKYEIKETPFFTNRNFIPGIGLLEGAAKWAFRADVGDISDVYRAQQGYIVFKLEEIQPAGYRPLEEVKDIIKNRVEFEKLKVIARQYAEQFESAVKESGDFQKIAANDTARVAAYGSTPEFSLGGSIPGIGLAPQVNAAAFELPLNQPSGLLEANRGFYFIKVLERTDFDEEKFAQQKDLIRQRLLQQRQQQLFLDWYNRLKKEAKIEDYRYQFYRG